MKRVQNLCLGFVVLMIFSSTCWSMGKKPSKVQFGQAAPSLYLYNPINKDFESFPYISNGKVSVLCFISYECPLSRTSLSTASKFFVNLSPVLVEVIGVSSMPYENSKRLKLYKKDFGIPFDLLYDSKGILAYQFQVNRAPTFFVFDQKKDLRYFGNVDGMKKAVMALLYGITDYKTETPAMGCSIPQNRMIYRVKNKKQHSVQKPVEEMPPFIAKKILIEQSPPLHSSTDFVHSK